MYNTKGFTKPLAAALTAGIVYSMSTAFWHFAPQQATMLHAQMMHLDSLDFMAPLVHVTLHNYISGLLQIMVWAFFAVWLFVMIKCHLCSYDQACQSGSCKPGQPRNM